MTARVATPVCTLYHPSAPDAPNLQRRAAQIDSGGERTKLFNGYVVRSWLDGEWWAAVTLHPGLSVRRGSRREARQAAKQVLGWRREEKISRVTLCHEAGVYWVFSL